MVTATPSAQCLRLLRRRLFAELQPSVQHICPRLERLKQSHRAFGISRRKFQQHPSPQYGKVPPTATGTITSNVTGEPPPPSFLREELSTAEMQRQIQQRLPTARSGDIGQSLAKSLRIRAKGTTETYLTYGLTQTLFKSCSMQASYFIPEDQRTTILTGKGPPKTASGEDLGVPDVDAALPSNWWFNDLGLDPTFSTWSQVTYLHMYLITVRLRAVDSQAEFQNYQRYLLEHFSQGAEEKMLILHSMSARGIRNRYLKDLFIQWRGLLAAYDEGLVKGDAALAGAVWRNMFKADKDVDWVKVSVIVGYMRRVAAMLGTVKVNEIARAVSGTEGIFQTARQGLFDIVDKNSLGIDERFGNEN